MWHEEPGGSPGSRCQSRLRAVWVLDGRYHAVLLRTPRQVHRAVRYVLLNARKHARRPSRSARLDPASSGRWFDFWREDVSAADPIGGAREVALPRSWLLRKGWRRHGRIGLTEVPGPRIGD